MVSFLSLNLVILVKDWIFIDGFFVILLNFMIFFIVGFGNTVGGGY